MSESEMKLAIKEKRVKDIFESLWNCFHSFKYQIFNRNTPEDVMEDVFWNAAFALEKKSMNAELILETSVCSYFRGFIKNFFKKYLSSKKKFPIISLDDDDQNIQYKLAEQNAFTILSEKKKLNAMWSCISKLSENGRKIIRKYLKGVKDKDIYLDLGLSNHRGVSVIRKKVFKEIKKCLQSNFNGLF